jgi:putative phage-type endonuclease
MSREAWLEERRKSLGGSDMGAVLGLNKYRSPYTVWAEKTGRVGETPGNEAMRVGRDLEPYVASRFEEVSRKGVRRMNYLLRREDCPHLHANIDRQILGESSGLECKTASALNLKRYEGGDFPESYYAQCVTYLAVTGWQRWYLAALVLGKGFYCYQITTVPDDYVPEWCESSVYVSPEEIEAVKRCAEDFWRDYVETDSPPPLDGAEGTTGALEAIYEGGGGEVELFGREKLIEQYQYLAERKKAIDKDMDTIKQQLMADLGDNERGYCGRYTVDWRSQTKQTFDAKTFRRDHPEMELNGYFKTSNFRRFTIKEEATA